ncbi:MAG TPA: FkbM family methyltransferase [Acetobacteraceae bacterium]|nr:FkbM family methyltransferase [Acetobacteraceae bacterium]
MLLISPGMVGATFSLYNGLAEFSDMAFVLHALRPEDLFLDIGANVGVYTILASAAVGATTISVEPLPATYEKLRRNIALNQVAARVESLNIAVGAGHGSARITQDYDATNHILAAGENVRSCEIQLSTIDDIVASRVPALMKIDIEGYELPALEGAKSTLSRSELRAIVIELNGSGARYGFEENLIAKMLADHGFRPVGYDPFSRTLTLRERNMLHSSGDNSIFVRDIDAMQLALKHAPTYKMSTGQRL